MKPESVDVHGVVDATRRGENEVGKIYGATNTFEK